MSYLDDYGGLNDRAYGDSYGLSDGLDDASLTGRINALDIGSGLDGYGSSGMGLGGLDSGIGLGSGLSDLGSAPSLGGLDDLGGLGGFSSSYDAGGNFGGLDSGLYDDGLNTSLGFTDDLNLGMGDGLGGIGDPLGTSLEYGGLGSAGLDRGLGYGDMIGGRDLYGDGLRGMGGLDALGGSSLDGLGEMPGLGAYDDIALGSTSGLGGLSSLDTVGLGGYGLDGLDSSLGGSLSPLGWSSNYDLGGFDSDLLGGAALGLGGAALGAAGASAYLGSNGLDGGLGGSGLLHGSSSLYGNDYTNPSLGMLGQSAFGYGAYDGAYSPNALQYADLASFSNDLYGNSALSSAERDSIWRERSAFDALDDAARLSAYNSYSPSTLTRLGLSSGYWGNQYGGNGMYDPYYGSLSSNYMGPTSYAGAGYSLAYGAPNFYDNYLGNFNYALPSSLRSYYGDYLGRGGVNNVPYFSDDSRFREAADLSYYYQRLNADRAIDSAERAARMQQRLAWEQLDADQRDLRWREMDEAQRERLGLGLIGSYHGGRLFSNMSNMRLPYELPSSLNSLYRPYMQGGGYSSGLFDPNYARYADLAAWSNALQYDRSLAQQERMQRWQQRMQFEQLDDAARRARWNAMNMRDRATLGLSSGYWSTKLNQFYDPSRLNAMQFPISSRLASAYQPYQSKRTLMRALQAGEDAALSFADLVSYENALRADTRLRTAEKLERWKQRVRYQELSEHERRRRYFQMQEAERRMLGLGHSSFWGRRYAAPLLYNGTSGLPPPMRGYPAMRFQLPSALQSRYANYLPPQSRLATGPASRSLVGQDPARNLANKLRLSIAQKTEQMPGLSAAQRLEATANKRRILQEMDNDRNMNANLQASESERLRRLNMH